MKRVSFEVAKAISTAGYWRKYGHRCEVQEIVDSEQLLLSVDYSLLLMGVPTYLEVWLWLWQEKGIKLSVEPNDDETECYTKDLGKLISEFGSNPEEAIVPVIDYLVEKNLIK